MKIAMVSPLWGPAYPTGSGIYAYELAKRIADRGHEVHVFTSQVGNFRDVRTPPNLHLRVLKTYTMLWGMNPIANVLPILLREDFDVVHVHSYIFYMSNNAAAARLLKDFRYVLNFHGGVSHNGMPTSCTRRMWIKDHIFDRTIGKATVSLADKVVSVSKADVPLIKEMFGVEAEYVPNAVATDMFNPAESGDRVITYVGKLEQWKGAEVLLDIFHQVSRDTNNVKFRVIGEGSLAPRLKRAHLPIELKGHIYHEEMPAQYQNSAVCVLPSFMEGAPTTCMESLACGVPCVASDVGDTSEIIKDGRCGYLLKPGDVRGFASRLVELLEDDSLRQKMGTAGRAHIVSNYSYDRVVDRVLGTYRTS